MDTKQIVNSASYDLCFKGLHEKFSTYKERNENQVPSVEDALKFVDSLTPEGAAIIGLFTFIAVSAVMGVFPSLEELGGAN